MAKPMYTAAGFGRGHGRGGGFGHPSVGGGSVPGTASWFGGNVPLYNGVGQPAADGGVFFFGNGAPVYLVPPGTRIAPRE